MLPQLLQRIQRKIVHRLWYGWRTAAQVRQALVSCHWNQARLVARNRRAALLRPALTILRVHGLFGHTERLLAEERERSRAASQEVAAARLALESMKREHADRAKAADAQRTKEVEEERAVAEAKAKAEARAAAAKQERRRQEGARREGCWLELVARHGRRASAAGWLGRWRLAVARCRQLVTHSTHARERCKLRVKRERLEQWRHFCMMQLCLAESEDGDTALALVEVSDCGSVLKLTTNGTGVAPLTCDSSCPHRSRRFGPRCFCFRCVWTRARAGLLKMMFRMWLQRMSFSAADCLRCLHRSRRVMGLWREISALQRGKRRLEVMRHLAAADMSYRWLLDSKVNCFALWLEWVLGMRLQRQAEMADAKAYMRLTKQCLAAWHAWAVPIIALRKEAACVAKRWKLELVADVWRQTAIDLEGQGIIESSSSLLRRMLMGWKQVTQQHRVQLEAHLSKFDPTRANHASRRWISTADEELALRPHSPCSGSWATALTERGLLEGKCHFEGGAPGLLLQLGNLGGGDSALYDARSGRVEVAGELNLSARGISWSQTMDFRQGDTGELGPAQRDSEGAARSLYLRGTSLRSLASSPCAASAECPIATIASRVPGQAVVKERLLPLKMDCKRASALRTTAPGEISGSLAAAKDRILGVGAQEAWTLSTGMREPLQLSCLHTAHQHRSEQASSGAAGAGRWHRGGGGDSNESRVGLSREGGGARWDRELGDRWACTFACDWPTVSSSSSSSFASQLEFPQR